MFNDLKSATQTLSQCMCFDVRMAARGITGFYNAMLSPSGLLATQFSVLMALSLDNPTPITTLAEILMTDRTTLARNLKPLERRGLVQMTSDQNDARVRLVGLTPAGEAGLAAALPLWEAAQDRIQAQLGAEKWATLQEMLIALTALAHTDHAEDTA